MTTTGTSAPGSPRALPLRCRVESSPAWAAWPGREAVLASLAQTLAAAWSAWQLPLRALPEWQAQAREGWPGDAVVRLRLGEHDRGVFVRLAAPADALPDAVAAALAQAATANREAWLTPAVRRRLQLHKADDAQLADCVRRGFAPAPGAGLVDDRLPRWRLQIADPTLLAGQPGDEHSWDEAIEMLNDGLFFESGLLLPVLEVEADATLPPLAMRVWVNDLPLPLLSHLAPGRMMVNDTPERLRLIGLDGELAANPANGHACALVAAGEHELATARQAGLSTWGLAGHAVLTLAAQARRHGAGWWTTGITAAALVRLADAFPKLVEAWRARFGLPLLAAVMRRLLDEQTSVRDLRAILEAMLLVQSVARVQTSRRVTLGPLQRHVVAIDGDRPGAPQRVEELDADDWTDQVRIALARQITHQHTRGQSTLLVYPLDPALEEVLRDDPASLDTLEGHQRLYAAVHAEIGAAVSAQAPVLLTTKSVRAGLRRLLAADLPELVVLAYEELTSETNIQPLGRVAWGA